MHLESLGERDIHNDVWIEEWTEDYLRTFDREKQLIEDALQAVQQAAEVFHVGSTSIKGLPGKEILDILICPEHTFPLESTVSVLESLGYNSLGACGRSGCYFLSKGNKPGNTFYAHVCYADHPLALDQLLFKKIIETNDLLRSEYKYIKHMLELAFPNDRNLYREFKGLLVKGVLGGYRHALRENTLCEQMNS